MRAGGRLRIHAARRAQVALGRPRPGAGARAQPGRRTGRPQGPAQRHPPVLGRRQGAHGQVRHQARDLRQDPRQGQPPCRQQPAGRVPQRPDHRGSAGRARAVGRRADAADGVPADLRRGGRDRGVGGIRTQEGAEDRCADRRPVPDHRPPQHLRRARHDPRGRLRHDARGLAAGVRAGRRRPAGHRRDRTARLLRAERAADL
ncbi:hypothetical protein D9M72_507900 [compost metagenome]